MANIDDNLAEKIERLPVWAKALIKDLRRERYVAVRQLNKYCDQQTVSRIYFDDYVSTGEVQGPSLKRGYVQSNKITIEHAGVLLNVYAHEEKKIRIQWSQPGNAIGDISFSPCSYQTAYLIAKDNMR
jgi:hypothetical protein